MQQEFFNRLAASVQNLVRTVEAGTGRAVDVRVDPDRPYLACRLKDAVILTPSEDYLPDGGVYHELRHLQRLLVEGVPCLDENLHYVGRLDRVDEGLHRLDNTLEHFVIVPEELTLFPEREEHWSRNLRKTWEADVYQIEDSHERRSWILAQAAFTELSLPDSDVGLLSHAVLRNFGLFER